MRRKIWLITAVALAVALALPLGVRIAVANTFAFDEHRVSIPVTDAVAAGGTAPDAHTGGRLDGVLTTPKGGSGRHGLVVFVHGDGPANASRDDAYLPIWEAFARAGYATLSWNKAGVGGTPGNWLDQSLADRGAEVAAALDWARTRPEIDTGRMGAWGVSQGGWVLPPLAARRPDLRFLVLVGAAINWLRQGEYNLRSDLRDASDEEKRRALARRTANIALLEHGATYQEYLAAEVDRKPMTEKRYGFALRNFRADVTPELGRIAVPTLLLLGSADRNVDTPETARVYAARMHPGMLTEHTFPGATHSLTRDDIEYRSDDPRVIARAIVAPRDIYAPGYLAALADFASRQTAAR
ncbi:alpha/beta hydrolase family protein [Tsukamurella ocularis]|uniref:alpha/beta hydrolase family protein n=1 Tax=Tsukamurella ocularis TaxID=1970234 RepID=UPI002168B9C3|nr:alpha/beta hydrolase [Tsukamurella ocularis]MCS3778860.1 dienelactone hydrolase [Tsukamurella ocularis]MCS3787520.1 dienelactone hydrolase [Tsukamurella ocularis]MCS3851543.1 dienelactone hydrolase [Tsukamurella ocularis]